MTMFLKMTSLAGITAALLASVALAPAALAQAAGLPYSVEASSDRGNNFAVSQVKDGNLTSAWGPHVDDLMPSITLNMGRQVQVSTLEIKLSPAGAVMDVEISSGGNWRTIATGLQPQAETLARVSVPLSQGDRLRLKFRNVTAGQLLVCEVRAFGENATAPAPTATAYPNTGSCFITSGGGWILSANAGSHHNQDTSKKKYKNNDGKHKHDKEHKHDKDHKHHKGNSGHGKGHGHDDDDDRDGRGHRNKVLPAKVTFGFTAKDRNGVNGRSDYGNIQVSDHGNSRKYHGTVRSVTGSGNTVTFTGSLKSGGTFTAVVTDNGEPGRQDRFKFSTSTGYWADGVLGGGNIQVKRGDCR